MSRKIRKGNDIDINWSLLDKDRNPYIVEGRNFAIELLVGNTKRVRISNATASGNTVHFTYYGKDQKVDGSVNLIYIENGGEVDMVTFDTKDAFTMVPHSWLAVDTDETPETVTLDVVTVVSELNSSIGPRGYSAYEIAVQHGYTGTEEQWLDSLKPLITADADGNVYCDGVLLTDVIYRVVSAVTADERERQDAETARQTAESSRVEAETARQTAESARAEAETARRTAENARAEAETARQTAESGRQTAETRRGENEATRQSQETARETAETQRGENESNRQSQESARETAEQNRTREFNSLKSDMQTAIQQMGQATETATATDRRISEAETARVQAENRRVEAETARQSAEQTRAQNEQTRQTQEGSRQTAETTRQEQESTRQDKEGERQTAEEGRATAESSRVSAEESRVAAETAREEQAQSDHTRAEGDHERAEEDHAQIADKADVDGYYSGMTVGLAENLIDTKGAGTEQSFAKRTSCGDQSIADDGAAIVQRFFGKSFVWNQLVRNGNFADGTENWFAHKATMSVDAGIASLVATEGNTELFLYQESFFPANATHKYYIHASVFASQQCTVNLSYWSNYFRESTVETVGGEWVRLVTINTPNTGSAARRLAIHAYNSPNGLSVQVKNFVCIDLTLLFGVGNEPSTVEEFEAWLRNNIGVAPYYGYTPGMLMANKVAGIRTIGFNRYNHATGNAELVKYDNGDNPMYQITGAYTALSFTDALGNTITPEVDANGYFDIPEDGVLTVTGGNDTDTCVHLCWSGYRDGEYEEYWEESRVKELTELKGKLNGAGESVVVFPDGLKSVGTVRDEIVGHKAIKRVGAREYTSGDENDSSVLTDMTTTLYVLATPEEYVLDEPFNTTYKVADFGTEEIIPSGLDANLLPQTAPFTAIVKYNDDFTRQLATMPEHYVRSERVKQVPGNSETDILSQKAIEDNYAHKTGYEPGLGVGAADNITGKSNTEAVYRRRTAGGTADIGSGAAAIARMKGRTMVWNQLVNSDTESVTITEGHKYLSVIGGVKEIGESDGNAIAVTGGTDMVIDLTLIFGAGNEPATVAEFEAMFPLPYYEYSEPKFISNKAEAIKTVGFNQWDEEWEVGAFDTTTGANTSPTNQIRSKNLIPIFGNTEYNITNSRVGSNVNNKKAFIMFYDVAMNIITPESPASGNCISAFGEFTTPANAAYMKFYMQSIYGGTYKNDICINLSWSGYRNGEYEPYWESVLPLNLSQITGKLNGEGESVVIFPDGLRSAGAAFDELVVDRDGVARRAIKRITRKVFDGSNEIYPGYPIYPGDGDKARLLFRNSAAPNFKPSGNYTVASNMLCYWMKVQSANDTDKSQIGIALYSSDDHYSWFFCVPRELAETAADFLAWLNGREVLYEMKEVEEYILDTPIAMNYRVDDFGTEERLPSDTAESVLPEIDYDVKYSINARDTLRNLDAVHKRGVIRHTQTWTGSSATGYDYTISNVVFGQIPTANIDIFKAAGAVFNEQTGYFELNELTDISYEEMASIFSLWNKRLSYRVYEGANIRTNLPFSDIDPYQQMNTRKILLETFYQAKVETIAWPRERIWYKIGACAYDGVTIYCNHLKKIIGDIKCGNDAIGQQAFNISTLEEIRLVGLATNFSARNGVRLSLDSVVYMVQNCGTIPAAGITITLHATAFARCQADTTEYTYNEQTYTGIIALAAAKNITIQSA